MVVNLRRGQSRKIGRTVVVCAYGTGKIKRELGRNRCRHGVKKSGVCKRKPGPKKSR